MSNNAGGRRRNDLLPLYIYEGKHFYLHSSRIGLHLDTSPSQRFDAFLACRFEGHPYDRVPASLAGMAERQSGIDLRASPIVDGRTEVALTLGLMYDFSPESKPWPDAKPLRVRLGAGKATDCDVAKTARLACISTQTQDQTRISMVEIGRPFIEGLHDWPLDFVGYVGLLRHHERDLQPDFWQLNAYMKGLWYGFPWSERVMTRLGLGVGLSYAQGTSMLELRDQQGNGRNTSRLLNYLDPTIDT